MENFYVTTPIYYPNDVPHLGHAYTSIAADVLSRWNKVLGKDVFFLTGTDEHGKKISLAAEDKGLEPKDFADSLIPTFKENWKKLNIDYDRFIRTTDEDHKRVVKEILQRCYDKGDIYLGEYEGFYCTSCEAYYTEKDSDEGKCPVHGKELEILKEESYFFRLSKYQDFLLDLYERVPDFISPKNRKQEIVNRVKDELRDFSISRTTINWGIPLPFDEKHVAYVWFDALINYISGVGYLDDEIYFKKFWPADVHIIGKDILWFHAVYWPAMLKSAGVEIPKKVFAHGWWTVHGLKMGKSAGNAIKIDQLVGYAGVDSARYFLLRNAPFGDDGDFSEGALISRHNDELADKLGNLVSRVSGLIEKNGMERCKNSISKGIDIDAIKLKMARLEFDKALNEIFGFIDLCNEYVQNKKPWETKDKKVLYELADSIKMIAITLWPFIPETSEKIAKNFGFDVGEGTFKDIKNSLKMKEINKSGILFQKIKL